MYQNEYVPNYYTVLSQYYSDRGGPFLLGDRITYADFAVFQSIDNDEKIGTLPVRKIVLNKMRYAFHADLSELRRIYHLRCRSSGKLLKAVLVSKRIWQVIAIQRFSEGNRTFGTF